MSFDKRIDPDKKAENLAPISEAETSKAVRLGGKVANFIVNVFRELSSDESSQGFLSPDVLQGIATGKTLMKVWRALSRLEGRVIIKNITPEQIQSEAQQSKMWIRNDLMAELSAREEGLEIIDKRGGGASHSIRDVEDLEDYLEQFKLSKERKIQIFMALSLQATMAFDGATRNERVPLFSYLQMPHNLSCSYTGTQIFIRQEVPYSFFYGEEDDPIMLLAQYKVAVEYTFPFNSGRPASGFWKATVQEVCDENKIQEQLNLETK